MTGLVLTLKNWMPQHVDLSVLTKDGFVGKSIREVESLPLFLGNEKHVLGDIFRVEGETSGLIKILQSCERIDGIGTGLRSGEEIIVYGKAGFYLGRSMTGGRIDVRGDAGDYAASALKGGEIIIRGNAGDFLAAGIAGERIGMSGGVVRVTGKAGARAGDQMRRGLLLIEGDVGDYCAARMVAGSIAVLGKAGKNLGLGMKRGTVFLRNKPSRLPATFGDCGPHALPFFHLFLAHIKTYGGAFGKIDPHKDRMDRFVGDMAVNGKGEVLFYSTR